MLHTLRLSIVNVYLLTGDKAILIDAGGPGDVPRILAFMKEHGVEPGHLSLIVATHGHWDHAGGAAQLRAETKAPIAVHRGDLDLARQGINGATKPTCMTGYFVRLFINRGYPKFEPDVVIENEMDLKSFGVDARIMPTPGHTPGSLSVLSADGDAIVGDLVMGGWLGGNLFPTRPGLHYFVDDLPQLHESIGRVLAASPRILYPGHGGPLEPARVASTFNVG